MMACEVGEALGDQETVKNLAAYLPPALCLALLDPEPEVRVVAAFQLMAFGRDAQSAAEALKDALQDPDKRVQQAARIALEYVQSNKEAPCLNQAVPFVSR
jgi:HEAT repeat protein